MARDGRKCCFSFWAISCPFTSLAAQKVNISKKKKKSPGDIIILHKCTKNHDHMIICYTVLEIWHMTHLIVFHFGNFFPFTPLTAQKNKISKKWKKTLEILSFYTCVPKNIIIWCTVPEIWWATGGRTEKVTYRGECPT